MKKFLALVLALCMLVPLTACGGKGEEVNNENPPKVKIDYSTLEGILTGIAGDFTATGDEINAELAKVQKLIGDTYSGYEKNIDKIEAYYTFCIDEAEKLYSRTWDNSVKYYKLVASSVDHDDSDAIDSATEDFYDSVYEDAFDDFYDVIYEDSFDLLYDDYYDGIIDDAEDTLAYKEWVEVRSDFYKDWVDARSDFYKDWVDARSDLYKDYVDIRKEFMYDKNFDVDDILNTDKKNSSTTESTEEKKRLLRQIAQKQKTIQAEKPEQREILNIRFSVKTQLRLQNIQVQKRRLQFLLK